MLEGPAQPGSATLGLVALGLHKKASCGDPLSKQQSSMVSVEFLPPGSCSDIRSVMDWDLEILR